MLNLNTLLLKNFKLKTSNIFLLEGFSYICIMKIEITNSHIEFLKECWFNAKILPRKKKKLIRKMYEKMIQREVQNELEYQEALKQPIDNDEFNKFLEEWEQRI